jgi:hypothetical protein
VGGFTNHTMSKPKENQPVEMFVLEKGSYCYLTGHRFQQFKPYVSEKEKKTRWFKPKKEQPNE